MSYCSRIQDFIEGGTVYPAEKVGALEHLKGCDSCKKALRKNGMEVEDFLLILLGEEEMVSDPKKDFRYEKRKEQNFQQILKRLDFHPPEEIKTKKTVFEKMNDFFAPGFNPAFATVFLVVLAGGVYLNVFDNSPDRSNALRVKSGTTQRAKVELFLREPADGSIILSNTSLKKRDVVAFSYSLSKDTPISLFHYKDRVVSSLIKNEPGKKGEAFFAGVGWKFKESGEHYFIALTSNEMEAEPLLAILKERGIEELKQNKKYQVDIKKVFVE